MPVLHVLRKSQRVAIPVNLQNEADNLNTEQGHQQYNIKMFHGCQLFDIDLHWDADS